MWGFCVVGTSGEECWSHGPVLCAVWEDYGRGELICIIRVRWCIKVSTMSAYIDRVWLGIVERLERPIVLWRECDVEHYWVFELMLAGLLKDSPVVCVWQNSSDFWLDSRMWRFRQELFVKPGHLWIVGGIDHLMLFLLRGCTLGCIWVFWSCRYGRTLDAFECALKCRDG